MEQSGQYGCLLTLCVIVTGSVITLTLESRFALARIAIRFALGKGSDSNSNSSP
jgi:hypothetical protein